MLEKLGAYMKEVSIKGKLFKEEEILDYGKKAIAKSRKILIIIGISLMAFCVLFACKIIPLSLTENSIDTKNEESILVDDVLCCIICGISGVILIILSFIYAKKNPYTVGVAFLNKHFPYAVGFDGKIIDLLVGDKIIELSKRPLSKLIILSSEYKFQVVQENKYSKIFNGQDVLDYEIRVNNEVLITSKTKSRKGVGKALIGGALFGSGGMIAGAIAGNSKFKTSQNKKEIHHYTLVLKINDIVKPSFVIDLPSQQIAEEVLATLIIICRFDNKIEEGVKTEHKSDKVNYQIDKFEEIKKYKELLDVGIITQEEFDLKKSKILDK